MKLRLFSVERHLWWEALWKRSKHKGTKEQITNIYLKYPRQSWQKLKMGFLQWNCISHMGNFPNTPCREKQNPYFPAYKTNKSLTQVFGSKTKIDGCSHQVPRQNPRDQLSLRRLQLQALLKFSKSYTAKGLITVIQGSSCLGTTWCQCGVKHQGWLSIGTGCPGKW